MSFSVRIIDAEHRPEVYAEIEYDDELVAEAYVERGVMKVAFVGLGGTPMWVTTDTETEHALALAREQLRKFGLLE